MPRKTTKKTQGGSAKKRAKDVAADPEETPPNPPPPPPAALVKLIQKNKSVLQYFQALQENLDYDVTKWKRRARKFQAESLEWKAKADQLDAERGPASASLASKKRPSAQNQQDDDSEQPQKQKLRTENKSGKQNSTETRNGRKSKETDSDSKTASKASKVVDYNLPSKQTNTKPAAADEDWLDLASMSSQDQEEEANANQKKPPSGHKAPPPLNSLAMSSEDSEEEEDEKGNEQTLKQTNQKRAPLHILALSSDDSEADDDDDEYSTSWLESQFSENQRQVPPSQSFQKSRNDQVLQSLKKANDLLAALGIALVEEKAVSQENTDDHDQEKEQSEVQAESTQEQLVLERREDSCVLTDLLQSIKALVRIHEEPKKGDEIVESYYPFMAKDLIPCFMVAHKEPPDTTLCPHPAVEGMKNISEALHLMETHCPTLNEIDDEYLNGHDRLVLGMKDRHILVSNLVRSLQGEICQLWPVQDRATRLLTASLHLEPNDQIDEDSAHISMPEHKIAAPTKNLPRLAALVERCFLAHLVSRMYFARQDPRGFFQFFWSYLTATTPAIAIDTTPFKLPPVQSICILESILCSGIMNTNDVLTSQLSRQNKGDWKWISQTVGLLVEVTGMIQLCRSKSEDERIVDTSRVELAAKSRLEANHPFWKEYSPVEKSRKGMNAIADELQRMVKHLGQARDHENVSPTLRPTLLQALLVALGNVKSIDNMFANNIQKVANEHNFPQVLACVKAKKWLEIRMIDKHRQVVLSPSTLVVGGTMRLWDYSKGMLKVFEQFLKDKKDDHSKAMDLAILALTSCLEMADGESTLKVLETCLNGLDFDSSNSSRARLTSTLNMMETVGQAIVVRVINLERRPDRLASFLAQAAHCNLLVMRAVMKDTGNVQETTRGESFHQFCHAHDGGNGRPAEIENRLAQQAGCTQEELSEQLVQSHWRPNDLQVFDSEAPDSLDETRISPSEKACALSHIASWKGAMPSLELTESIRGESTAQKESSTISIFRSPSHWRQRFQISGYARGPPLFPTESGEDMPPTPVCIILEDDAILVDRFADRLQNILEELPRDFHFCSIGYSRPKTAPLIPFASEISIPTCIWYLTGYIVSLKGCHYLLNQLPVRGPVDSWIGLQMFQNWDNMYGHNMGVGMPKATEDKPTISKKDLRKLFKFRAFCATVPLCSQKVGVGGSTTSNNVRNWRQRDTDIVYSGNSI